MTTLDLETTVRMTDQEDTGSAIRERYISEGDYYVANFHSTNLNYKKWEFSFRLKELGTSYTTNGVFTLMFDWYDGCVTGLEMGGIEFKRLSGTQYYARATARTDYEGTGAGSWATLNFNQVYFVTVKLEINSSGGMTHKWYVRLYDTPNKANLLSTHDRPGNDALTGPGNSDFYVYVRSDFLTAGDCFTLDIGPGVWYHNVGQTVYENYNIALNPKFTNYAWMKWDDASNWALYAVDTWTDNDWLEQPVKQPVSNLNTNIGTRVSTSHFDSQVDQKISTRLASADTRLNNLDGSIAARLASSVWTTWKDSIPWGNIDTTIASRLAESAFNTWKNGVTWSHIDGSILSRLSESIFTTWKDTVNWSNVNGLWDQLGLAWDIIKKMGKEGDLDVNILSLWIYLLAGLGHTELDHVFGWLEVNLGTTWKTLFKDFLDTVIRIIGEVAFAGVNDFLTWIQDIINAKGTEIKAVLALAYNIAMSQVKAQLQIPGTQDLLFNGLLVVVDSIITHALSGDGDIIDAVCLSITEYVTERLIKGVITDIVGGVGGCT